MATDLFQSTPPRREATQLPRRPKGRQRISIHASPKGGDAPRLTCRPTATSFQSTPPRREATADRQARRKRDIFQSTPPRREATDLVDAVHVRLVYFNPRLPEGRRPSVRLPLPLMSRFQSTPPRREATSAARSRTRATRISIHASPKGGDVPPRRQGHARKISIHASPKGGDCKDEHGFPYHGYSCILNSNPTAENTVLHRICERISASNPYYGKHS